MGELQPHIRARLGDLTPYALLPGDPARVWRIAAHLRCCETVSQNREYVLVKGMYKETPVTVMSTGMGGVSVAIGVEELARCGVRYAIRIGSAGALQPTIHLGDLVIPEGAVRDEGTTAAYQPLSVPAIPAPEVYQALISSAEALGCRHSSGLIRSHDSFYRDDEEQVSKYWHDRGILAAEMEAAALFVVGSLRKMRTGAVLNVVVEYGQNTAEGITSYVEQEVLRSTGEQMEIQVGLEALHRLYERESSVSHRQI